jgi:hypothetical protein
VLELVTTLGAERATPFETDNDDLPGWESVVEVAAKCVLPKTASRHMNLSIIVFNR